jgi:two-component system sensor histidine kinase DesK
MTSPASLLSTLRDRLAAAGQRVAARLGVAATGAGSQGWFERFLVPAILTVAAVGQPVIGVGRVLDGPHRTSAVVAAVLAAACSAPLGLWLLVPAARARAPRRAGWLVAAYAAVNLAAFAVIGAEWFSLFLLLGVMAVAYLPPRWSVPAVAALAAAPAAMAAAGHDVVLGRYFAFDTLYYALLVGMVIWLARIAVRLRAGRQELADSAVITERVRIDDELKATIGAELERLIAAGEHAARAAAGDPAVAERELRALTGLSRRALARTRRMVSQYQVVTVRSELSTAMALLTAAGIGVRSDVPATVLGQALESQRLAGFRSGLTTVLHDDTARACVIAADGTGGDLRLEIRREHRVPI